MDLLRKSDFDDFGSMGSSMGSGMGRLVPLKFFDWDFFDRQKSMFSLVSKSFDDDFKAFDMELDRMRRDMFKFDSDPMLKVDQPFIEDFTGTKKMSLTFDCSQYKPEAIQIKTVDNTLTVHAKHEEKSPGKSVYREFTKSYTLPRAVDPLTLTSSLSKDGVLSIEAPAPKEVQARRERLVPIERLMI